MFIAVSSVLDVLASVFLIGCFFVVAVFNPKYLGGKPALIKIIPAEIGIVLQTVAKVVASRDYLIWNILVGVFLLSRRTLSCYKMIRLEAGFWSLNHGFTRRNKLKMFLSKRMNLWKVIKSLVLKWARKTETEKWNKNKFKLNWNEFYWFKFICPRGTKV